MNKTKWQWKEGEFDPIGERIELRYGNADESSYSDGLLVALIGKPKEHIFPVKWAIDKNDLKSAEVIEHVAKDLDFYLVEKGGPDPWAYAKHHCTTAANIYSRIHWSYFPKSRLPKK